MRGALLTAVAALSYVSYAAPAHNLQKREGISSCGPHWMPVADTKSNHDQILRRGFDSAVDSFCDKAKDQTLGAGLYLSMATRVFHDYGGDPHTTGINGFVYFEIHNKQNSNHVVNGDDCKNHLKELSKEGGDCWGKDHRDTKGGTWQAGDDKVSYHALAEKKPPGPDEVDKTVIFDREISPIGDGGKGNTLDLFPTYVFDDIVPVGCHSHNDYTRDTALYSALQAGCISVEADIYPHGDKLVVGHDDPGAGGQTLQNLYLDPIKRILDEKGSIFPLKPDQSFSLLIDFKGDGDETWDLLVKALEPLRTAGHLSHHDGEFKLGKLTVIASGNAITGDDVPAPIQKAIDSNPDKALFVDARIHKDMSKFDASNTYYASASFKDAVQGGGGEIKGDNLNKMKDQIKAAHGKGFVVRYYDIPSSGQWQQMIDEGVDRINVDDLQDVAGLDFKLPTLP